MKRRFFSLFFVFLSIILFAGCQERQLYPLEDLSVDQLESILFLFSKSQDDKYFREFPLQGSQMDEAVEVLRGLRMTSEIEWNYTDPGSEIILFYQNGKAVEINGDAEAVRIGDRYYLWPWKSRDAFDGLIEHIYNRIILTEQIPAAMDLLYKINVFDDFEQVDSIEW